MPSKTIKSNTSSTNMERTSPEAKAKRTSIVRHMTGLSLKEIVEKYHETYQPNYHAWQHWEAGKGNGLSPKGADKIEKIARAEGIWVTSAWLLHGTPPGPRMIESSEPLPAKISYGNPDLETDILKEVQAFHARHPGAIDYKIPDDAMEPKFSKEDCIMGIKRTGESIKILVGHNCIVQTSDGELLFRHIHAVDENDKYMLTCLNPQAKVKKIAFDTKLDFAAPVTWHRYNII